MHFYGIFPSPGHAPAELEDLQVEEDFVIEKSAEPSRIMAAYLEALAHRVSGNAISFNIGEWLPRFCTPTPNLLPSFLPPKFNGFILSPVEIAYFC